MTIGTLSSELIVDLVMTRIFRWDEQGVEVLGKISGGGTGMPFGWPLTRGIMKYFNYTLPTALVSAVVGVVDSIVAARENSAKFGYAVSPNRELVALGRIRLLARNLPGQERQTSLYQCSLLVEPFQSLGQSPVSDAFGNRSSPTGSRLNGQIGARSQMASIITSFSILLSIFFLLPYFYFLPKVSDRCECI